MGLDMYLHDSAGVKVAYWRKANAIHGWFCRKVGRELDSLEELDVSREDLQKLIADCKAQLDDPTRNLVRPVGGFFFGSTEMDSYWLDELRSTIELMGDVLASHNDTTFKYVSWF